MSIADLYHIKRAIQQDEEWRPQRAHLTPAGGDADSPARSPCLFCRTKRAQYACPTCQAPYCSLSCFRAPAHAKCAVSFAKSAVRANLEEEEGEEDGEEGEGRKAMMAILGRAGDLSLADGAEEEEGEEGEEEGDTAAGDGPSERPLAELEPDVRLYPDFCAAWRPLVHKAATSSSSTSSSTGDAPPPASAPAAGDRLLYNIIAVLAAHAFITADLDVRSLRGLLDGAVGGDDDATDVPDPSPSSSASTGARPRRLLAPVLQSLFSDLVPFLTAAAPPAPPASHGTTNTTSKRAKQEQGGPNDSGNKFPELVLVDAEDVVLWLLSRMQPVVEHADVRPTTLLRNMLARTADVLEESKIISAIHDGDEDLPESGLGEDLRARLAARSRALGVLADIWTLFSSSPSKKAEEQRTRRKLVFYAAVLLVQLGSERVERVVREVRGQVMKLEREAEVERERDGLEAWTRGAASHARPTARAGGVVVELDPS
ncbi:hypothetical protein OC844_007216 [Tilletia horrida]|nr:hypothetical protein OC844_007216 [Tilletia horrida]